VKDGIRKPDVLEQAALGRNADDALLQSFEASFPHVYTAVADGHPVAMFGVAPLAGQDPGDKSAGVVWLLASDRVFRITRDFIEQASAWIEHMNNIYPVLVNWTDERKAASRRWLEHVGFIFYESFEEVDGVKFLRFYRAG